ncbi:cuticle protein 8 [Scaptodrosophila lebanonensis]|uniref:Cuticle protein 8 n=1 Tax=Drosophila lebanonensis TaxID=7225 RepID=A0A6J2TQF2_DROLE|nr:cuticle protein 8 [Scaptodrosophila lebanonensis]
MALVGYCMGGFAATYAGYHPNPTVARFYHTAPPSAVYQQTTVPFLTKTLLPAAPIYTKSIVAAPAPYTVAQTVVPAAAPVPVVKTVAAPAPVVPVLKQVELQAAPRYDFSYGVHDSVTGDIKSQVESRSGSNVVGTYSVLDADGYKRTVTYTADDINGFNAVVQREPVVAVRAAAAAVPVAAAALPTPINVLQPQYYQQPQLVQQPQQLVQQPQQLVQQPQQLVQQPQQLVEQPQPINVEQESEVVEAPRQPEQEPAPVDYTESQQQPQQQPQYPQDQQFPPYPAAGAAPTPSIDDSDVVEARSALESEASSTTPASEEPLEENKKTA